jgi:3-(3-hydroxy-phenyl)propionate hydroxylase
LSETFAKDLLHWRTSRPHDYGSSPPGGFADAEAKFDGGPACGQALRNLKLGDDDYLLDRLGSRAGFYAMVFIADGEACAGVAAMLAHIARTPFPVVRVLVGARTECVDHGLAEIKIPDVAGRVAARFDARAGTVYLLRPDLHVCARWPKAEAAKVCRALEIAAMARTQPPIG